jgi:hypothetical protein
MGQLQVVAQVYACNEADASPYGNGPRSLQGRLQNLEGHNPPLHHSTFANV